MKRSELLFNIVSIPLDALSLLLAALVSFYVRTGYASRYVPVAFVPNAHHFLRLAAIATPIVILIYALFGLYNLTATRKFSQEFAKIFNGSSMALLAIIVLFFFDQQFFQSRLIVIIAWAAAIIIVTIMRAILKRIQVACLNRGYGLHSLVIIDGEDSDKFLVRQLQQNKSLGYRVTAVLHSSSDIIQQLEELYKHHKVEEIFQLNPLLSDDRTLEIVQFSRSKGLNFNFVPNLFNVQRNAVETEEIEGMPYITLKNTPLDGWGKIAKRIFDVACASLCLVITSPVFLVVAVWIKLDSPGKVLYTAPRGGKDKDFAFLKFRTMYSHMSVGDGYGGEEAEKIRHELWKVNARGGESGPFLKIKDDPRVTRVGRILRKTKLDEIPQFINVLRGDMSMVGPRAHVIDEVERYRNKYRRIFTLKPGIFGLSQISQISWPDLPFEEEIRLNTYYIENWSLWLDISTLAKTFYLLFIARKSEENY
jgi:exopolysaccharide biosynthesis polyprenyl glycosylphosphotransferase